MPTLRELIKQKSEECRHPDQLGGHRASELLVELSSLLSSLNTHLGERLYWLNIKKVECLKEFGSAARAKIYAEGSNEWREFSEAKLQQEALIELVRSLKFYLRNLEVEQRESKY